MMDETLGNLPQSVRYVKNGSGGRWWQVAKERGQLHCGWWFIPRDLLLQEDLAGIKDVIKQPDKYGAAGAATADYNALCLMLGKPSQHIWITFEKGYLWWCTVRGGITVNTDASKEKEEGSFWLTCDRPWNNRSIGDRLLARADLPGKVATVAGFRATICEPSGSAEILRVIQDREDPDAVAAASARAAYTSAVAKLIEKLHDRDFELLIDLILARTGWNRLAKIGGSTEGIDIEAENVATNEIAFVQVKSKATQKVLNDYVRRFQVQRERYNRMIFAVHSPEGDLADPEDEFVKVWKGDRVAQLAVQLGLGEWIANRI
jgi:hypothetical protein